MCDSYLIADGKFSPITIQSNDMCFDYTDKFGKVYTLIEKFAMDITIVGAKLEKLVEDGEVTAYQFVVYSDAYTSKT